MHTSLIDAITLNRQNVEIYTRAYHPCRLLPHRIEDDAFQTPHKLCVPSGSVRFPPEACVLLIQRVSGTIFRSIHSFIHPFSFPFIFIHSFSFIHSLINFHSFFHSFIHLPIHLSIHPSISIFNISVSQSVDQSLSHSVSQSFSKSVSQPTSQSVSQPAVQSVRRLVR